MKKLLFITPSDSSPGFAVAGAEQRSATPEELGGILDEAVKDERVGVIAVDERLLKDTDPRLFRVREAKWSGVFVVVPPPEPSGKAAEEYLQSLISRAIGYHVRITR